MDDISGIGDKSHKREKRRRHKKEVEEHKREHMAEVYWFEHLKRWLA